MNDKKKSYQPYMQMIGPITSKQFGKVQVVLNDYNEQVRMEALYNMLVMMKRQDEETTISED